MGSNFNAPITTAGPAIIRHAQEQHVNPHYIVVEDPENEFWEGSIIPREKARALSARGLIALPYEPSLSHVGNGGFQKRSWGGGYPLDYMVPRMTAPLTLFCTKSFLHLTWRARIMPQDVLIERVRKGEKLEGMLRFAADTGSPTAYVATITSKENPLYVKDLGKLDDFDGWVIGGTAQINIVQEGHYGFALYGMAPGVRVIWAAATATALPVTQ